MSKVKLFFATLALMVGFIALVPVATSYASPASQIDGGAGKVIDSGSSVDLPTMIRKIIDLLLFAIGAVAVIMIIFGAFRYVLSGGDSSSVTAAKNTILYAVIGLVVAILAYAIVHFVTSNIK
jgi:hypothetical protein